MLSLGYIIPSRVRYKSPINCYVHFEAGPLHGSSFLRHIVFCLFTVYVFKRQLVGLVMAEAPKGSQLLGIVAAGLYLLVGASQLGYFLKIKCHCHACCLNWTFRYTFNRWFETLSLFKVIKNAFSIGF